MSLDAPDADQFTVETSEAIFFVERDETLELLRRLAHSSESVAPDAAETIIARLTKIFDKYQEQSNLLDPHLEAMLAIVTTRARELIASMLDKRPGVATDDSQADQEGAFPFQVCSDPQLQNLCVVVYQLCRCRGHKCISKLFPPEVADLEPVLHALYSQDRGDHRTWETRYTLLLWLGMLVLIPFDIYTIDSSAVATAGALETASDHESKSLVGSIITLCESYLHDTGPTREAAAICLVSLLTRPDMESSHLNRFMEWARVLICAPPAESASKLFVMTGVLTTLASIFKHGHREKLTAFTSVLLPPVLTLAGSPDNSTLMRKFLVKLCQRIGLTFLPPRAFRWQYQRGQRSLLQNLGVADATAAGDEASAAPDNDDDDEDDDDADVPPELEDVLDQLLNGLRDRDTVVRWSAAKGIGRVTGRLPKALADDVVGSVLDFFSPSEGDGAWHGACLALAELSRRGLLLPSRLPQAVPCVIKAIHYDVRRGSNRRVLPPPLQSPSPEPPYFGAPIDLSLAYTRRRFSDTSASHRAAWDRMFATRRATFVGLLRALIHRASCARSSTTSAKACC